MYLRLELFGHYLELGPQPQPEEPEPELLRLDTQYPDRIGFQQPDDPIADRLDWPDE